MSLLSIAAAALAFASSPVEGGPCRGAAAQAGAVVAGVVLHVIDGERLCLADGPTVDRWVEMRLSAGDLRTIADDDRSGAKAALMGAAFGKKLSCRVEGVTAGRAVASCTLNGAPLADLMASPAARRDAAAWREPAAPAQRTLIASR